MSAIDPLSSGSAPTTVGSTGPSPTVPLLSGPTIPQDSITAATSFSVTSGNLLAVLLEEPTIINFSQAVNSAIDQAKHQSFAAEQQESLAYKDCRLNSIETFADVQAAIREMLSLTGKVNALYNSENLQRNQLNAAIATYNQQIANSDSPAGSDAAQLLAMNTAIAAYNAGTLTDAQFNLAVTTYNAYAAARNAQIATFQPPLQTAYNAYNVQIEIINTQIPPLNAELKAAHLHTVIPLQNTQILTAAAFSMQAAAPLPKPLSSLSAPFQPSATLLPNPPAPTFLQILVLGVIPLLISFLNSTMALREKIDSNVGNQDFIRFYQKGKLPQLPNSYITPIPEAYLHGSGGAIGAGSGAALTAMITGLNNPALERILSQGLFTAANDAFNTNLSAPAINLLQLLTLQQLAQSGLFSGKDALKMLADRFTEVGNNPTAVSAALGLAFAKQIAQLIASGDLRTAIAAILQASNPQVAAGAIDAFTALANLNLLKIGLSQLAQAFGLPDLPAQVVGQLATPPAPPSPLPTLSDILSNELSVAYLKHELGQALSRANILTATNAQGVVNDAVNAALANSAIRTADQLHGALIQEFTNRQLSQSAATKLANLSADYLQAEIVANYTLDTAIKQDSINRSELVATIAKQSGLRADTVTQAVTQAVIAKEYDSQRELRDAIVNDLNKTQPSGQSIPNIFAVVTQAVADQARSAANLPPVQPLEILSANALTSQLQSTITGQLTPILGGPKAADIALQVIGTLLGNQQATLELQNPLSFTRQIQDQITTVQKFNNETLNKAVEANFVDFQKSNLDLYTFNRRVMDPGNTLLYSMWTGIMYQGQGNFPTNFQHALQFNV